MNIGILNTASYIPSLVQTNEEVCSYIEELTPQWILEKTGIKQRYHCDYDEKASFMASVVAEKLMLENGFVKFYPHEIGLIVIASFSQDYYFPPMSVKIHSSIGAPKDCQILDINVNCVGIVTGTTIAVERMRSNPRIKYAIVIGVEVLSKFVDKTDKFTAPFFSDGASGILLGRVDEGGFDGAEFCTDSSVYEEVKCPRKGFIYQNGKATWAQAITHLPYVLNKLVKPSAIDFIIFHQANKVLIEYLLEKMKISPDKTYINVDRIGNTGAASIGIALDEAWHKGLIKKGSTLVMAGVGAGFNFGASIWKMQ